MAGRALLGVHQHRLPHPSRQDVRHGLLFWQVAVLEKEEQRYERLEKLEGIYDWMPSEA